MVVGKEEEKKSRGGHRRPHLLSEKFSGEGVSWSSKRILLAMGTELWATRGYIVRIARLCLVFRDRHTVTKPIRDCLRVLNTNVLIPSRESNFKKSKWIFSEEPDYMCQSTGISTQSSGALEAGRVIRGYQRRIKMKVWVWVCGETVWLFIMIVSYLLAKTVVP